MEPGLAIGSQRNRAGPPFDLRSCGTPRHAGLRHGCRPPRMRLAAGRVGCCPSPRPTATRGTLGIRRPDREGCHIRTVPIPDWVAEPVAVWLREAGVTEGAVFRAINKAGRIAPKGFSPKVIWVWSNKLLPAAASRTLCRTTFAAHARACVTKLGENSNRFNCCWDMSVSRPPNGIWAANGG